MALAIIEDVVSCGFKHCRTFYGPEMLQASLIVLHNTVDVKDVKVNFSLFGVNQETKEIQYVAYESATIDGNHFSRETSISLGVLYLYTAMAGLA